MTPLIQRISLGMLGAQVGNVFVRKMHTYSLILLSPGLGMGGGIRTVG